jgi:hypothetical protein
MEVSFTPRPLYPRETPSGSHRPASWEGPKAGPHTFTKMRIACSCRDSNCNSSAVHNAAYSRYPQSYPGYSHTNGRTLIRSYFLFTREHLEGQSVLTRAEIMSQRANTQLLPQFVPAHSRHSWRKPSYKPAANIAIVTVLCLVLPTFANPKPNLRCTGVR